MIKLRTTELEFKGQLQGWINEILMEGQFPFEAAGSESSLEISGTRRHPDLVLWLERKAGLAFVSWEMKGPELDADDPELVRDAMEKARALKLKYFVTFNLRAAILWQLSKTDEEPINVKTWRPKCAIGSREDFQDKSVQASLKDLFRVIILDLAKLHHDDTLFEIEPDTFFVTKITEAANQIFPLLQESLIRDIHHDKILNEELNAWAATQGIANFGDAASFELIARQMAYRLLGKILFFQTLRRYRPDLPPLDVGHAPDFSRRLQEAFARALQIDYQAVFQRDLPDKIPLPEKAQPVLAVLIDDLRRYDFSQLPQEIIGSIFEKIIPHQERHRLGQYFTSENLVDLILALTVRSASDSILDPACGSGTFLIRAYDRLRSKGVHRHNELLKQLWGVDIAPFPAELATINLYRQNLSEYDNFPRIIVGDFFDVVPGNEFKFPPPKPSSDPDYRIRETMPAFDAAVGNFPYIRQELIERAQPDYKKKIEQVMARDWRADCPSLFKKGNSIKLSGQADLYAYMFLHAAKFLKPDGRMGFVTSNAWLDVGYGHELQNFFLEKFKIIAILESRCEPWFETAAVNTIVTIVERCENAKLRDEHQVKFVKVKKPLPELIPWDMSLEPDRRWYGLESIARKIEGADETARPLAEKILSQEDPDLRIRVLKQKDLLENIKAAGKNPKWGKYLRGPDVYFELIDKYQSHLVPLTDLATIKFGIKTGINDFFYPEEYRIRQFDIEEQFLVPVLKSPREFDQILIDPRRLDTKCFFCPKTKEELKKEGKTGALRYIKWGEKQKTKEGQPWPQVPSVRNRKRGWWSIPETKEAQIFWSKAHDVKLLHRWSPTPIFADCRVYYLESRQASWNKKIAAILNSSISLLCLEMIGRVSLGEGALDIMVEDVKDYMVIPDPQWVDAKAIKIFDQISTRPIKSIFDEIKMPDRRKLDQAIMAALGIEDQKWLERLHQGLCELVSERITIASKRKKAVANKVYKDVEKLKEAIAEQFLSVLGRKFPESFIDRRHLKAPEAVEIVVSNQPLRLGRPFMMFHPVVAEDGFEYEAEDRATAKFIVYSQKSDSLIVRLPKNQVVVEKAVQDFEIHLQKLSQDLFSSLSERVGEHKLAGRLANDIMEEFGLRKL